MKTNEWYKQLNNGTYYHHDTPEQVIKCLETARLNRSRVRIFYGDSKTGQDWGEEHDVTGYIGRSGGNIQIPLLLPNKRSIGGGAILDHCIVKIMIGKRTVYQHKNYRCGEYKIEPQDNREYLVTRDGRLVTKFRTHEAASRWVAFMKGERHTKGGRI